MKDDLKTSLAQRQIDDNLRRVYADLLKEEVPDRFTRLIAALRDAEKGP